MLEVPHGDLHNYAMQPQSVASAMMHDTTGTIRSALFVAVQACVSAAPHLADLADHKNVVHLGRRSFLVPQGL